MGGTINVCGSKNAATPVLAASLLCKKTCVIENIPLIEDVFRMIEILKSVGAEVSWIAEKKIKIEAKDIDAGKIDKNLVKKLRSSVLLIGALLGRMALSEKTKSVLVPHPGGCIIGSRPLGAHFDALSELGVFVSAEEKNYLFSLKKAKSGEVVLAEISVTATENILMFSSVLKGTTVLKNAAIEPHVLDLVKFLNAAGADIRQLPGHIFVIKGRGKMLGGAEHFLIYDPVEAGTFMVLGAVGRGGILVRNVCKSHLELPLKKMTEFGVNFKLKAQKQSPAEGKLFEVSVKNSKGKLRAAKIQTLPYPGFPTDLQSIFGLLMTQASGTSLIYETMYEGRLKYLEELVKMGANANVLDSHRAVIIGPTPLFGKDITSFDLRSGAALIVASVVAQGKTDIDNVYQVDRGYEKIDERLKKIGVDIKRI